MIQSAILVTSRVCSIDQAVQYVKEFLDIVEMKPGRGLIQDIQRSPCRAPAQLPGEFNALRLPSREGGCRLPQLHVPQPHVVERLHLLRDGGDVFQERESVADIHVQQVRDGVSLVLHGEGFAVITLPPAGFAQYTNVRQKVHLDPPQAVPLARFAPAPFHIEAEPAGLVSADPGLGQQGKKIADVAEEPGIRGRIGTRCAADGRLVYFDDLVHMFYSQDGVVFPGIRQCAVKLARERPVKDVTHEG